jgi:hypothetical protein
MPRLRGVPTFGFAAAGLLVGHTLSYLIAIPDPHHRDLLLHATGHAYLPAAAQAALLLALAAVAAVVARAWSGRGTAPTERITPLAATLAAIQVGAFVGQEVLERLIAGAPFGDLVHDHLLPIGIAVQIAVALGGAVLLRWLARTSARAVSALSRIRTSLPRPTLVLSPVGGRSRAHAVALPAPSTRDPPSP